MQNVCNNFKQSNRYFDLSFCHNFKSNRCKAADIWPKNLLHGSLPKWARVDVYFCFQKLTFSISVTFCLYQSVWNILDLCHAKMGDQTPKKTMQSSFSAPSSIPKPNFLPEPKSFSTKKVWTMKLDYFWRCPIPIVIFLKLIHNFSAKRNSSAKTSTKATTKDLSSNFKSV